ncbi:hypothetical protein [Mesorhizobium argentiipisi]|uniref:Uncharacterized protein n=1 Tax=Mesorhizobium argentiipisi TaxID=3015175 RepID=A0ABU8KMC3_9HYPH
MICYFALKRFTRLSLGVVAGCTLPFLAGAITAYDPSRRLMTRKQDTGGNA